MLYGDQRLSKKLFLSRRFYQRSAVKFVEVTEVMLIVNGISANKDDQIVSETWKIDNDKIKMVIVYENLALISLLYISFCLQ